jgi:putative hydrolase of the HAD superfamily
MSRLVCSVFDVDDTLYLERDYIRSGFDCVGEWVKKWLDIPEFSMRCWTRFLNGERRGIFDNTLTDAGCTPTPELISGLVAIYRTHRPAITLAQDSKEALVVAASCGPIAVISDGPATSQTRKIEALGLAEFARSIIVTEMLGSGFSKPHPRAFETVARTCAADTYVYIGDNPLKDFSAPEALGWLSVRVRRSGGLHEFVENVCAQPDLEIPDCSELCRFIPYLRDAGPVESP